MSSKRDELLADLEGQQERADAILAQLTDEDLGTVWTDDGTGQEEGAFTIRRLVHRIITHHQDHLQHILQLRREAGKPLSEVDRLATQLAVARAELAGALRGMTDADLAGARRPDVEDLGHLSPEGNYAGEAGVADDYSIERVLQHVQEKELLRWEHVQQAMRRAE